MLGNAKKLLATQEHSTIAIESIYKTLLDMLLAGEKLWRVGERTARDDAVEIIRFLQYSYRLLLGQQRAYLLLH